VKIKPQQQIVCVSPGIIEDAGMTVRREDRVNLARRRDMHPKRRFLRAIEVARMIHFLLYVDEGYTSGVVIRMNGGAHG
jgi:NAD(P)-dependent dehydrogenase (short-subunit alcohol dehydrogenase family)